MANSILKLNVETSEYDAKLKKAAEGIRHLAEVAHKSDGDMTGLEKSALDYIKAVGEMETKSRTAAGQVRELESTFKELTVVYNNLNDVEKADEGGKALAASLERIKQRAQEARAQLDTATQSLNEQKDAGKESGGIVDALTQKYGLSIDKIVGFGTALGVAKVALDVAKDAFFATEGNIDEWGRTVQSSEAAYNVFLDTLNNGNWSNFFTNLSTAVKGARDLYDALDRLGSIKSNNQAAIAIVQQQIAQLRLMKQQGKNVDDQIKAATKNLRELQGQSVTAGKKAGAMQIAEVIKSSYNSQGGNLANSSATDTANAILKGGQRVFDQQKEILNRLEKKGTVTKTDSYVTQSGFSYQRQYKDFDINQLTKEEQKQYKLAKAITEKETEIEQGISTYAQAVQEGTAAAREEFKGNRYALQGTGSKGGKKYKSEITFADDSIMAQEKLVSDLTQKWKTASGELRDGYLIDLEEAKEKLKEMQTGPAEPDLDKLFPDMSEQNFNTGYAGSKQAKQDGTRGDFGMAMQNFGDSATSTQAVGNLINETRSLIQQADLGSELYNNLTAKLQDATTMQQVLQGAIAGGIQGADLTSVAEEMKAKLLEGDISEDAWQEFLDKINEKIEDSDLKLTFDVDTKNIETMGKNQQKQAKEMVKDWQAAGSAIQTVGSAMSQIEDPAAKVVGTIGQAIATIALGFAQATAKDSKFGVFGWIAAVTGGLATMISTISAIHSATGYAEGGIIKGNSYSGDNLMAQGPAGELIGLNAGEVVLNRAQTANLASQLEGGMQDIDLGVVIGAEDIRLVMNNSGRRTGRGEYVQSRRYNR